MEIMRKQIILFFLVALSYNLYGIRIKYRVTSMKLNVAEIEMELNDSHISVAVKSRIKVPLFPSIDNRYEIIHDGDFRPLHYTRIVNQAELTDSVYTRYHLGSATMHQSSNSKSINYKVRADTRDVFSLLAKISDDVNAGGTYYADGNGRLWQVKVSGPQTERISTALGKQTARRHDFTFQPLSPVKAPYIDMITFNFLDPDTRLTLWVSVNGVPLKAHLKKGLMSMNWDIQSVGP
jgi:hypothetical protein